MAKLSADATLFGLDLSHAWAHLRHLGSSLPLLNWLKRAIPATPVLRLSAAPANGELTSSHVLLRGDSWCEMPYSETSSAVAPPSRFHTLLLPEELVLLRTLRFPHLDPMDLEAAVQLEALALSPFTPDDTVIAYSISQADVSTPQQVQLVLASRATVHALQQEAQAAHQLLQPPEMWVPSPNGPILCKGWGEQARLRYESLKRRLLVASVGLILALLTALALTPSLKLRQQVLQAQHQTQALVTQTQEVAGQRQALMAQMQTLGVLPVQLVQQIDPLKAVVVLTRTLPDDTALQSLTLEGNTLKVQGLSDNASRVQELLSKEPGFRNVRLPAAITREGSSGKESFVLEAELDPATFVLWQLPQDKASTLANTAP